MICTFQSFFYTKMVNTVFIFLTLLATNDSNKGINRQNSNFPPFCCSPLCGLWVSNRCLRLPWMSRISPKGSCATYTLQRKYTVSAQEKKSQLARFIFQMVPCSSYLTETTCLSKSFSDPIQVSWRCGVREHHRHPTSEILCPREITELLHGIATNCWLFNIEWTLPLWQ